MNEKDNLNSTFKYKSKIFKKIDSSLNIPKFNNIKGINNFTNNLKIKSIDSKNKLKIKKIKLNNLKILKDKKKIRRNESISFINKKNFNISLRGNKSCGEIANQMANNNMSFYLDDSHKNKEYDSEEKGASIVKTIDKYLTKKEKYNYLKEKEKILKNLKNINHKKIKKCFTQDILNDENISFQDIQDKSDLEHLFQKNKIKFNINNASFYNPLNSFNTIYQNKKIYKDILDNYKESMISEYEKSIIKLNPIVKQKSINSKQKITIFPYISKSVEKDFDNNQNSSFRISNKVFNLSNIINNFIKSSNNLLVNRKNKFFLLKHRIQYPRWGFPESRIESSFSQEGNEYILYGGYNSDRMSNLWKFNPEEFSWNLIKEEGIKNKSRYGHSGVLRYRNLYIFGGLYIVNKRLADLEIFNLDKKKWFFPKLNTIIKLPLRRNHIGCSIGTQMLIQGGIDENDEFLNDCYVLNYHSLQWFKPIINEIISMPYIAYHSCCLVVPEEIINHPRFSIYNYPTLNKLSGVNIREKGLYIFGGKIPKNNILNKNLYVLRLGKKPLDWVLLKTQGISPSRRYGTTMTFFEQSNILIIHGGSNNNGSTNYVLNDTFILDLYNLNWIKVEYYDNKNKVLPRFFHHSFIYNNDFIVFGGTNGLNYLGSEMFILEMDSHEECLNEREEINNFKVKTNMAK